jgi:hypothetical protein
MRRGMAVRLLIEGASAVDAVEDLARTSSIELRWSAPAADEPEKIVITLSVIATIVGIAGGTATIADQISRWWQRWKDRSGPGEGKAVEKVVIEIDERRVLLGALTDEEVARLLDKISKEQP